MFMVAPAMLTVFTWQYHQLASV